jgi:hypothetical protein
VLIREFEYESTRAHIQAKLRAAVSALREEDDAGKDGMAME